MAAGEGTTPEKLRQRLEKAGRLDDLREDLSQRLAVDFLAEQAKPMSAEQASVRDKIWTPAKGEPEGAGKQLWTPGS
jgi:trigger factor